MFTDRNDDMLSNQSCRYHGYEQRVHERDREAPALLSVSAEISSQQLVMDHASPASLSVPVTVFTCCSLTC